MLVELLLATIAAGEPGFGGAPADDGQTSCVVKDDDGSWISCDEMVAKKDAERAAARAAAEDEAERDDVAAAPTPPPPPPPALPQRLTPIEEELAKVGRSVDEFPLAAVRRDVQRFDIVLDEMQRHGGAMEKKAAVEEDKKRAAKVLDEVERIAVRRMTACAARRGIKLDVKNTRMTPAGPVMLTGDELLSSLPVIDPEGCERFNLVDKALVARVQRAAEIDRILASPSWRVEQTEQRKKLETERKVLREALDSDVTPQIFVPGAPEY